MANNRQYVKQVAVNLIQAGSNDRTHFDETALRDLATSIQQNGLAQPITVRPMDGGKWFQIVAGERRFRAVSQILQWETIPALVRELSDEEAAAIMLVENTGRVDLDPIAEANAYQKRVEQFGWDVAKIADIAGVNAERVRGRLKLLHLAEDIQHFVRTNAFPMGHALAMIDAELDKNRQRIALRVFNAAKTMPLTRFQDVIAELRNQQIEESQLDMFGDWLVQQVASDVRPLRGKQAKTGAPIATSLPSVKVTGKDNVGDVMDRYIMELLQHGHTDAAAAIGNVYNALVAGNWIGVPAGSVLAKTAAQDETAGNAPVEKLD